VNVDSSNSGPGRAVAESTARRTIGRARFSGRRWIALQAIVVFALIAAALPLLYANDPAAGGAFPPCVFHQLTGLHCPGCGTLRAVHQLLRGNFMAAMRLNPLAMFMLPLFLVVIALDRVSVWRGAAIQWHRPRWVPAAWRWGVVILIVAFGILRNVPTWPFTLLAPH
jgi:hypothetical protein